MHWRQTRPEGEDLVGLFGYATDKYAVLCRKFPRIAEVLGVPCVKTMLYGTGLVGIFCTGNSSGLLLPYFIEDSEIKELRKFMDEQDVAIARVDDRHTALGNLIACNDKGALVSYKIRDTQVIEDTLGVEVVKAKVAGHEEVGSCLLATNKGFIAHPEATEEELEEIAGVLKVNGLASSINCGFPYPRAGLIANSNGYVTGQRTTGIELGRIDDALQFI